MIEEHYDKSKGKQTYLWNYLAMVNLRNMRNISHCSDILAGGVVNKGGNGSQATNQNYTYFQTKTFVISLYEETTRDDSTLSIVKSDFRERFINL